MTTRGSNGPSSDPSRYITGRAQQTGQDRHRHRASVEAGPSTPWRIGRVATDEDDDAPPVARDDRTDGARSRTSPVPPSRGDLSTPPAKRHASNETRVERATRACVRASLATAVVDFFESIDLSLEIMSHIRCALTLRRASCVCKTWCDLLRRGPASPTRAVWEQAWLELSESTAAAILRRAPPGERIKLLSGTRLRGEITISPIHLVAEPDVCLLGRLVLDSSVGRAAGSWAHKDSCYVWDDPFNHSWLAGRQRVEASQVVGIVEGLSVRHFMEDAISVAVRAARSTRTRTGP
jgi:hypothetical protein